MSNSEVKKPEVEQKTEEQLDAERAERFAKDPHSFIELSELITGCIRYPEGTGVAVYIGNCKRSELTQALTEVNHRVHKRLTSMDIESEMRQKVGKKVLQPGEFAGGLRKMFRGK